MKTTKKDDALAKKMIKLSVSFLSRQNKEKVAVSLLKELGYTDWISEDGLQAGVIKSVVNKKNKEVKQFTKKTKTNKKASSKSCNKYINKFKNVQYDIIPCSENWLDMADYLKGNKDAIWGNFLGLFGKTKVQILKNKNFIALKNYINNGGIFIAAVIKQEEIEYYNLIKECLSDNTENEIAKLLGKPSKSTSIDNFLIIKCKDIDDVIRKIKKENVDVFIMNPPYDGGDKGSQLYATIIKECINIKTLKRLIAVSPSNAFLSDNKKNKESRENFNKYKPVLHLSKDWSMFVGAHPTSFRCISEWNLETPNEKYTINGKTFDAEEDIRLITDSYLEEFFSKLCKYIQIHGSLYDISVANPKNEQYFDTNGKSKIIKQWGNKSTYFTVLPYCIASHSTTYGYEQYSDNLWNGPARLLIPYNTKEEAKNCFESIQNINENAGVLNDFYKLIADVLVESRYIKHAAIRYKYFPIVDYSKSYTTEEMFSLIGMKYDKNKVNELIECLNF